MERLRRLGQRYRDLKIRDKMVLAFSALLVVYTLIGVLLVEAVTWYGNAKLFEEASGELNVGSSIINSELRRIEDFSFQIMADDSVQAALVQIADHPEGYDTFVRRDALFKQLITLFQDSRYLGYIDLQSADGTHFTVGNDGAVLDLEPAELAQIRDARGGHVWILRPGSPSFAPALVSAREIRDKNSLSLRPIGLLSMKVDVDRLAHTYIELSGGKEIVIARSGALVYASSPEVATLYPKLARDVNTWRILDTARGRVFATHLGTRYAGFDYYTLIPYDAMFSGLWKVKAACIVADILLCLVSLWLIRRLAAGLTRPLEELTGQMKQVQTGDWPLAGPDTDGGPSGADEIGQLYVNFHRMLRRIDQLVEENYVQKLWAKEAEFQALQAQIHPHFLYNTLNSINWLAKINRQHTISRMVEALGAMFRSLMDRERTIIPLAEELALVRNYLTIQEVRFGARLQCDIRVDDGMLDCQIPKLTLQPLVENAIKHGLERVVGTFHIRIRGRLHGEEMTLTVSDDGPGMAQEVIQRVLEGPEASGKIGLRNIQQRLKSRYGERYGLTIRAQPGKGTAVTLRLPCQKAGLAVTEPQVPPPTGG
ncbi:sensor histidine kinase [Alicyclobacillus sp.]|uniref:sensor histidine kinase n=1 Tax=Alicyclobacillus sp. TaxID=61169 RepID=UPI0025C6FF0B|nr:sensor histidine kinase [Alicyclobacillus sp.]MCL6515504.1 sensor histidine kinase [Alicyclobacillus sp.]